MKVKELVKVVNAKRGYLNKNGVVSEPNEERTFEYLTLFGLNVELIQPASTRKVKNPDVFIMGTIWEVKTPISSNKNTIKNRFREACKQAPKIIFDLRFVKCDAYKVKQQIIDMFEQGGRARRMIIIDHDGTAFDFYK